MTKYRFWDVLAIQCGGREMPAKQRRATRAKGAVKVDQRKTYRVLVHLDPHERAGSLHGLDLDHACMPQPPRDERTGITRLHAYASGHVVETLRKTGRKVEVLADAIAEGERLRKLIGKGDRFEGGRRGPRGVGKLV